MNISYLDDWIAQMLAILDRTGLRDNTVVILTSDHGDMLGERGLWFKMSFFEESVRVPLIVNAPGRFEPGHVRQPVSHIDLLPTLKEMFAPISVVPVPEVETMDGVRLMPLIKGLKQPHPVQVIGEYMGEGAISPLLMIRSERYKFVYSLVDPPQLFNLQEDPDELHNLVLDEGYAEMVHEFQVQVTGRFDLQSLDRRVRADQIKRRFLFQALSKGQITSWDYQPPGQADQRFMRNHLDLNQLESSCRYPRPKPTQAAD